MYQSLALRVSSNRELKKELYRREYTYERVSTVANTHITLTQCLTQCPTQCLTQCPTQCLTHSKWYFENIRILSRSIRNSKIVSDKLQTSWTTKSDLYRKGGTLSMSHVTIKI